MTTDMPDPYATIQRITSRGALGGRLTVLLDALAQVLPGVIGDAYAYRVGESDPTDPDDEDMSDQDWAGMLAARSLAEALNLTDRVQW